MITGRYSGREPAMTALMAIFSIEHGAHLGGITPITSCGSRLLAASMRSTRSGVGGTIGSPSLSFSLRNQSLTSSQLSSTSIRWDAKVDMKQFSKGNYRIKIALSPQPLQGRHVVAHTAGDVVGGLVAEASFRRGDVENTVTLLAAAELARTGTQFELVMGKEFRRRAEKIARRRSLARADVERPCLGRCRLERQINRATNVADIHRVVQLIAALRDHPLFAAARLLDQLPVKRQRSVARFLARSVNRHEAQRDEFDAVGLAIVAAQFFAADFERAVEIRRLFSIVLADRLARRRRVFAGDFAVGRLGASKNDPFDIFRARHFEHGDRAACADLNREARAGFGDRKS